jgi:DNA-binding response OmpR family regulator
MSRILVVEDDFDLRFLYANVLARQGHEVVGSPNTLDAMLHLTNQDFDVIILDMNMPDVPGLKVVEFAHDDVRLRKIPIIIVSANEHWREKTYPLGVRHFLVKPVPMHELLRVVKEALSR